MERGHWSRRAAHLANHRLGPGAQQLGGPSGTSGQPQLSTGAAARRPGSRVPRRPAHRQPRALPHAAARISLLSMGLGLPATGHQHEGESVGSLPAHHGPAAQPGRFARLLRVLVDGTAGGTSPLQASRTHRRAPPRTAEPVPAAAADWRSRQARRTPSRHHRQSTTRALHQAHAMRTTCLVSCALLRVRRRIRGQRAFLLGGYRRGGRRLGQWSRFSSISISRVVIGITSDNLCSNVSIRANPSELAFSLTCYRDLRAMRGAS